MSRSINLDSLYQIINNPMIYKNKNIMKNFLATLDDEVSNISNIQIKYRELETFKSLYEKIGNKLKPEQKEAFYYGYKNSKAINQEFDLLRFNKDTTLNIELKSEYPNGGKERIEETLRRQNHILLNCTKNVINYAYVLSDEKLYLLAPTNDCSSEDYKFSEVDFSRLIQDISSDYVECNKLETIKAEDLIISPYSEPEKFIANSYYLNQEQKEIVDKILETESQYYCISGGAGTGKSLVLFHLAKQFKKQDKSVILVFCGKLENYRELSETHNFDIIDIKSISFDFSQLKEYDVVLFDEFQRVRKEQYNILINLDLKLVVYSVDKKQTLHPSEKTLNIEDRLNEKIEIINYHLGDKIRQNNEMSWFIRKLLQPNDRESQPADYKKVTVKYFDDRKIASEYIKNKCNHDQFVPIELTEYNTKITGKKQRESLLNFSKNIHDVIGKEYNNVIVIFDEYIYYDVETAKLTSNYKESNNYINYPYDEFSCYFEALTRVRDKLEIVIINNPDLYETVLEILNWRKNINEELKNENENLKEEIRALRQK
ncbi:DNA/RNA helicase domain-containing protein [Neofamilia massiliensis]|uniref:DNA/RNA helicase domain-containing protein n=1 Tax=Neofamilia massiliensis TaxID=1673724 RepID=UPI0006BB6FF8|nr:DNA/RNA helicase domain-containing protein [Neofamilia massiliensis]